MAPIVPIALLISPSMRLVLRKWPLPPSPTSSFFIVLPPPKKKKLCQFVDIIVFFTIFAFLKPFFIPFLIST